MESFKGQAFTQLWWWWRNQGGKMTHSTTMQSESEGLNAVQGFIETNTHKKYTGVPLNQLPKSFPLGCKLEWQFELIEEVKDLVDHPHWHYFRSGSRTFQTNCWTIDCFRAYLCSLLFRCFREVQPFLWKLSKIYSLMSICTLYPSSIARRHSNDATLAKPIVLDYWGSRKVCPSQTYLGCLTLGLKTASHNP